MYVHHYLSSIIAAWSSIAAAQSPSSCASPSASASGNCSSLANSTLSEYQGSVLNTTYYPSGSLDVSGKVNNIAFCEVYASVSYGTNDSLIFALWLPSIPDYSSRFMAVGNIGFAGTVPYSDMMAELNSGLGFAVAGGTAGHLASDNPGGIAVTTGAPGVYQPFLHDVDQLKAWQQDAISTFTPAAKSLLKDFYCTEVKYSYFRGCSTGGDQGYSLAEFHPGLFDGIIAGCSANYFTHLSVAWLWNQQHTNTQETQLSGDVLDFIQASAIQSCDKLDGSEDGLIENPLDCEVHWFEVSDLVCSEIRPPPCLTPSQVSAAQAYYQGPVISSAPDTSIFPGLVKGSEAGWWVQPLLANAFSIPILQNTVYNNLSYDASLFNYDSDVDTLDSSAGALINAINPDLTTFRDGGGKMIVYAGWADPEISPLWSLNHVQDITDATLGEGTTIGENDFVKLVFVPGGGHCGSQIAKYPNVPGQYDISRAIVNWVEEGVEPVDGIKSWDPPNGKNTTRRLCTWPNTANLIFHGGDVNDWESYYCG